MAGLHDALEALFSLLRREEGGPASDDLHGRVEESIRRTLLEPLEELRVGRRAGLDAAGSREAQDRLALPIGDLPFGPGDLNQGCEEERWPSVESHAKRDDPAQQLRVVHL